MTKIIFIKILKILEMRAGSITNRTYNVSGRKVSVPVIEKTSICMRCGAIGHQTEDCKENLPSVEALKAQMDQKVEKYLKNVPEEWKEDDFGLYIPSEPRIIDTTKSWKDGKFCFNCGCFGHTADICKEPPFETLHKMFLPYLSDNSTKSMEKRRQIIDAINNFCDIQQEERD